MKKRIVLKTSYESKTLPVSEIDAPSSSWQEKELSDRATYLCLNGVPPFPVNAEEDGRYRLLWREDDFASLVFAGEKEVPVHLYRFSEKGADVFSLTERIKQGVPAMEEAYAMKKLIELDLTQEQIASLIGQSRSAVANTLRLLTLTPETIGLIESGQLSAGHARALVKVPKEKQYPFALETVKRGSSVRETERAVKAFLTPPEILQKEKDAARQAKNEELRALIERMRHTFETKVSLIGNEKKGRIYIDYFSTEDLYRFEEYLDVIDNFKER